MKRKRRTKKFRPKPLTMKRRMMLISAVAVPVLIIFTFGNRGLFKRIQLENEHGNLIEQLYEERATGDSLRLAIEEMKTDSVAIERLARERFGMVRPGETLYKVVEE